MGFLYGDDAETLVLVTGALRKLYSVREAQNSGVYPQNPEKTEVQVSHAEIHTLAVDTGTAIWVSTAEKTVLRENQKCSRKFGWCEHQFCIKIWPLKNSKWSKAGCSQGSIMDLAVWFALWILWSIILWVLRGHFPWKKNKQEKLHEKHLRFSTELPNQNPLSKNFWLEMFLDPAVKLSQILAVLLFYRQHDCIKLRRNDKRTNVTTSTLARSSAPKSCIAIR